MIDRDKEVQAFYDCAAKTIERSGSVSPMIVGVKGDHREVLMTLIMDEASKDVVAALIDMGLSTHRYELVVMMNEAWTMENATPEQWAERNRLGSWENVAGRKEIVAFSCYTIDTQRHATAEIIRDGDRVSLGPLRFVEGKSYSRFAPAAQESTP